MSHTEQLELEIPGTFPACAVTRPMAKETSIEKVVKNHDVGGFGDVGTALMDQSHLKPSFLDVKSSQKLDRPVVTLGEVGQCLFNREQLILEQGKDLELSSFTDRALSIEEAAKVTGLLFQEDRCLNEEMEAT